MVLCCGTLSLVKRGYAMTRGLWPSSTDPTWGFLGGEKAAQLAGSGRRGQETHYSQNRKERNKACSSRGSTPPLPHSSHGNSARELRGVLGGVKEGLLARFENC